MFGRRENEGYTTRELQNEIEQLKQTIKLRDREIEDIKTECASQFKKIGDLCFCNDYDGKLNKLRTINEIAQDNFSALVKDMAIDRTSRRAKIIELPMTAQSNR